MTAAITDGIIIDAMVTCAKNNLAGLEILKESSTSVEETLIRAVGGAHYLVTYDEKFRQTGRSALMTMRRIDHDEALNFIARSYAGVITESILD